MAVRIGGWALRALGFALVFASAAHAQKAGDPLKDFDAYAAAAVKAWRVPGLAIAVVKDDSVVFAKGYGVRTLGQPQVVDIHTLFANGSTTKAFTSYVVATLADAGALRLDGKVIDYLPTLQLFDPYVTRDLTVRDLLTHRSGLPEADYLWYGRPDSLPQVLHALRWVEPTYGLRSHFQYQNETYAAAGTVAAMVAKSTWEDLVTKRVLEVLGMRETALHTPAGGPGTNVATPHFTIADTVRVIDRYATDNVAPAGSMYSSVSDMTRWVRFLLDSTSVGGRRALSDSMFAELWRPQMLVGSDEFYPTAQLTHPNFTAYGLGWFLEDYRGEKVVFHTGSIDGMSAIVGLIPQRRLGVVVFANLDHAEVRHALMYRVFDAYLPPPRRDWSAEMLTLYHALWDKQQTASRKADSARVKGTSPSLPLARYAGVYTDPAQGRMVVTLENGALVAALSPWLTADLEPWNYDTFAAKFRKRWLGRTFLTFRVGPDGQVAAVDLEGGGTLRRQADSASSSTKAATQ